MRLEDIVRGESKNLEFKAQLPEKSIKYIKTVVAFANGTGGKVVFGVDDVSHQVIGVDNENVFKTMDAIANAISDSSNLPLFRISTCKRLMKKQSSLWMLKPVGNVPIMSSLLAWRKASMCVYRA